MAFKKGQSGNPAGRPKGAKTRFSRNALEEAIAFVEQKKKINLLRHFVEKALQNDTLLIALIKKLIPDPGIQDDMDWTNVEVAPFYEKMGDKCVWFLIFAFWTKNTTFQFGIDTRYRKNLKSFYI